MHIYESMVEHYPSIWTIFKSNSLEFLYKFNEGLKFSRVLSQSRGVTKLISLRKHLIRIWIFLLLNSFTQRYAVDLEFISSFFFFFHVHMRFEHTYARNVMRTTFFPLFFFHLFHNIESIYQNSYQTMHHFVPVFKHV